MNTYVKFAPNVFIAKCDQWCEGDVLSALEEEAFDERDINIELKRYGNSICDTKEDPFGVILSPTSKDAIEYLKSILTNIGSTRKIGDHSEISIN